MTDLPPSAPPAAPAVAPVAPPARKALSGPNWNAYIHEVLKRRNAKNYLEIGVRHGVTFAGVACPSIGVDPVFIFDRNPMGAKKVMHLYQMTSDDFFADYSPSAIFGRVVDVAFLDGLHQYEYLLRDFINTEKHCGHNSLILLDDCLPVNTEMTERVHDPAARVDKDIAGWWTGDVWKVVTILREYRPDLRITPVDVHPTGNVAVSNLNPASTVLSEKYFEIVDRFHDLVIDQQGLDDYWRINAPIKVGDVFQNFEMSRYFKA